MIKNQKLIGGILAAIIVSSLAVLGYMLYFRTSSQKTALSSQTAGVSNKGISLAEVEQHTGREGNSCWVVVDNTVYEISGFALWADGVHAPSGGRARCGKDLTSVIGESGHGRSVLKLLKIVGSYAGS